MYLWAGWYVGNLCELPLEMSVCEVNFCSTWNYLSWRLAVKSVMLLTIVMYMCLETSIGLYDSAPTVPARVDLGCMMLRLCYVASLYPLDALYLYSQQLVDVIDKSQNETKLMKQNVNAHQHPLIKMALDILWLSSSIHDGGTAMAATGLWPVTDNKHKVKSYYGDE